MNCTRCNRPLVRPVHWQGNAYGTTCAKAVGAPVGKQRQRPQPVRDESTPDLFEREREVAATVHALIGGVSLEMNP